jgi:hypothetical protein
MELVDGTYQSGHVELGQPVDWPDGTRVDVKKHVATVGMPEGRWPRDAEGIEQLIREWDAIKPLVFTQAEQADFEASRKEMGGTSVDKLHQHVDQE